MKGLLATIGLCISLGCVASCDAALGPLPFAWPPQVGESYPALALRGLDGEVVELSAYRGKVLFIEPIGMT